MKKTITVALVIVAGAIGAYQLSRHSEEIQAEVTGRADDLLHNDAVRKAYLGS